jgi:hypothetical protein
VVEAIMPEEEGRRVAMEIVEKSVLKGAANSHNLKRDVTTRQDYVLIFQSLKTQSQVKSISHNTMST